MLPFLLNFQLMKSTKQRRFRLRLRTPPPPQHTHTKCFGQKTYSQGVCQIAPSCKAKNTVDAAASPRRWGGPCRRDRGGGAACARPTAAGAAPGSGTARRGGRPAPRGQPRAARGRHRTLRRCTVPKPNEHPSSPSMTCDNHTWNLPTIIAPLAYTQSFWVLYSHLLRSPRVKRNEV